jgi:hypothetical protein
MIMEQAGGVDQPRAPDVVPKETHPTSYLLGSIDNVFELDQSTRIMVTQTKPTLHSLEYCTATSRYPVVHTISRRITHTCMVSSMVTSSGSGASELKCY